MVRAMRPFPVPVSPRTMTGTVVSANRSTSARTSRIASLSPMISWME
jgi:hypothetical protein